MVNVRDENMRTPLFHAAQDGTLEVAKFLVSKGAEVNAREEDGETPLHFAAKDDEYATVQFLVEKGAEVNARDRYGKTPLYRTRDARIKEYLAKRGAVE